MRNLTLGNNVIMGPNATMSWSQVTNANTYSVEAWRNSGYATYIDGSGVYTGTVRAEQIYGRVAYLSESVEIGSVGDATDKTINFYANGSSEVCLQMTPDKDFYMTGMNDVTVQSMSGSLALSGAGKGFDINYSGIKVTGDTEFKYGYQTLFSGDVRFGPFSKVGFFGNTPITQKTATYLSSSATLPDVVTKVNGILGILSNTNYGLIDVT